MKRPTSPEVAKRVDTKSNELIAEFHAYRDGIIAEHPDDPKLTNERIIFESWAIQKIAGLHCVIEDLLAEVHGRKNPKARR